VAASSLRGIRGRGRAAVVVRGRTVVHTVLVLGLGWTLLYALGELLGSRLLSRITVYEDVGHATTLAVLGHSLVVVLGELCNDVPRMEEAGNLSWEVWSVRSWVRRWIGKHT
jgi:hypothetical protein